MLWLVVSCTCCLRFLSASNCISLLPGAGVILCSVQSIFGRLKSPMMTCAHSCCDNKISPRIVSSSAAVILVFLYISTSLRYTAFLGLIIGSACSAYPLATGSPSSSYLLAIGPTCSAYKSKKVKSSMARSLPVENLCYQRMWGQWTTTCSNYWSALWRTPSCSRPLSATDNGVRDGRSIWLVAPPTLMGSTPWAPRIARC